MNALWVTRMSAYQHSPQAFQTAKAIINVKMNRQNGVLRKYHTETLQLKLDQTLTKQELLLVEARMAKHFWKQIKSLVQDSTIFPGRKPRARDPLNQLLDVGYHHLANVVRRILDRHDLSSALGLLRSARTAKSTPLVYDLMELFRSDVVDVELLRFIRLKKRRVTAIAQQDIGHFLHAVNARLERRYYLKDFKGCCAYRYYMELQIVKFAKAINHGLVWIPLVLPDRHETRCKNSKGNSVDSGELLDIVAFSPVPHTNPEQDIEGF